MTGAHVTRKACALLARLASVVVRPRYRQRARLARTMLCALGMTEVDLEIQRAVERELKWDSGITHSHLQVAVDLGIVTLSGTVLSYADRIAAQDAAHKVSGVLDVANEIRVQLPEALPKSDAEIARAVRLSLEWEGPIPDRRIRSTVAHGEVTLEGEVENALQREDAARVVHNLPGVRRLSNQIEIAAVDRRRGK